MKYLSKLLAFLSQVPNGNVTDTDLFVVIHRALKEATDAGLIDSDDLTTARLHQSSKDKEYAIVSQSLINALVKEVKFLKPLKEEYQRQARELRSRVDALENQVGDLKAERLAKANENANMRDRLEELGSLEELIEDGSLVSNQSQPKSTRKAKAEAKGQLVDGTFIACVLGA
tara:strand:+ start:488 stop:1006 length:519 start_codon:yes stop_codon:yes gene_type:complete